MRKFTSFLLMLLTISAAASADVVYKGKYVKQSSFDGEGVYILAYGEKSFSQLDASKSYGYMPATTFHFQGDDILASTETDAARLTFAETDNGYSIVDASGRYIAMTGNYNSFNVYASAQESYEWEVSFNADGTVCVKNFDKEKTIMLGISYGTWGSYPEKNDDRAYPNLYKYVAGDEEYKDDDPGDDPNPGEGDGTKEAPLSVAQLKAHEMNSAKVWVKGYIVGSANGSLEKTEFGASEPVASNIILADDSTCTDINLCIPVQLPTGAVRSALNLLDNPSNLGKAVTVYGTADTYFKVAGVKNVSDYVLGNGGDPGPGPEDFEEISIGEFLSRADTKTTYILTGEVCNIVNTTYGNFDLVDGNDTIYIYGLLTAEGEAKQFESLGIEEGDYLTLSGKYTLYNDMPEIKNAKYISHISSPCGQEVADELVLTYLKENKLDEAVAYAYPGIVNGSTTFSLYGGSSITTPSYGAYVYFLDLHPGARWTHECTFIYVNVQTGAIETVTEGWPPSDLTEKWLILWFGQSVRFTTSDATPVWYDITGKRIATPTQPGLYIKTVGGKASKTAVR